MSTSVTTESSSMASLQDCRCFVPTEWDGESELHKKYPKVLSFASKSAKSFRIQKRRPEKTRIFSTWKAGTVTLFALMRIASETSPASSTICAHQTSRQSKYTPITRTSGFRTLLCSPTETSKKERS